MSSSNCLSNSVSSDLLGLDGLVFGRPMTWSTKDLAFVMLTFSLLWCVDGGVSTTLHPVNLLVSSSVEREY